MNFNKTTNTRVLMRYVYKLSHTTGLESKATHGACQLPIQFKDLSYYQNTNLFTFDNSYNNNIEAYQFIGTSNKSTIDNCVCVVEYIQ